MKIMDIHSHTYYSRCGKDAPSVIIDAAVNGGIELFGISDHNHGICERKHEYSEEINKLKELYKDRIQLLCGIEIAAVEEYYDMENDDYELFDYCLIEGAREKNGLAAHERLFGFTDKIQIPKGLAHTDLFLLAEECGESAESFCEKMAEHNVFWELNISYDSIHEYREHEYVKRFFESEKEQEAVRKSGMYVSIGFDGHRTEDYLPERIKEFNKKLEQLNLNTFDMLFKQKAGGQ